MTPKKVLSDIVQTVKHPIRSATHHPLRTAAIVGGAFLVVDLLTQPKGHSIAAKASNEVLGLGKKLMPSFGGKRVAALPAGATATSGPFGPGWGRGFMPYQYGGHYPESPAEVSAAHRAWAAAEGSYPQWWSQSQYPWA